MQEIRFPKEVLNIIKGYEYSLISYEETIKEKNRKEIINNIKIHVFQPYYLKGTKYHKSDEGQIEHVINVVVSSEDYKYINREEIINLVLKFNNEARETPW